MREMISISEKSKSNTGVFTTIKKNIDEVLSLSAILKTSFGPLGMDKVIKESQGEITITNDGATILNKAKMKGGIRKMLTELSLAQDHEIGDGTTGVIIFTAALLEQAEKLLDNGIHPTRIAEGFNYATDICLEFLNKQAQNLFGDISDYSFLLSTCMTTMNSKVINRSKKKLAEICTKAVLAISDLDRRDVNLDLIKIEGKVGGNLENSMLINGILLNKEWSHSQMPKKIEDARLCVITCPFEPPRPKNKHEIEIENVREFRELEKTESEFFHNIISQIKNSGANVLICQWGFDDEGTHLLLRNKISSVRWVSGLELEFIAISCGAQIVPRFNEITSSTLGFCGRIKEFCIGTEFDRYLIFEDCPRAKSMTILIRGGSELILNEAKRAIIDAMSVVRILIRDSRIVTGGGSVEMACAIKIYDDAEKAVGLKHYVLSAYSEALKIIPFVLAENSGYDPVKSVSSLENQQRTSKNFNLGINCEKGTIDNMIKLRIFETLANKQQQLQVATQMANAILRIDDVINI
jgi:T-complex protein 1 subunit epsilon